MTCPACGKDVLEIDVRCMHCGHALAATGAHRLLGTVVLGQYELVDVLGQGGMSVVFKGKHKMTNQEVALKILPPELAAHSQVKSRFLEEAKALAALDHPNIVHLYNFGQENGLFVLAMQYVQGRTWERIILENKRMDWQSSVKVAIDVLRALEYAHGRGVVHRDMKPSNVLVRAHDGMATVMDFGIAKMTTSTKLTATGQTMGTVRYMSPEQVRGQDVDLRTDIYSLGATLYESLTGDTPFDGSTHFEIMTKHLSEPAQRPSLRGIEVPKLVEDALMRSLMKRIDDHFENAREMRKILEASLREGDLGLVETQKVAADIVGQVRASLPPKPRVATATPTGGLADELEGSTGAQVSLGRPKKRSRAPLFAALALLVAGGAAAAVMILDRSPSEPGAYRSRTQPIKGSPVVAGATIEGVLVETTGVVQPVDIARAYQASLAKLRVHTDKVNIAFVDPLRQIVAIPAAAFCEPSAYPSAASMPTDCGTQTAQTMIMADGTPRMLILDDLARLQRTMDLGVADAICLLDTTDRVCVVSEAFRRAYEKPSSPDPKQP